ncbi:hypothetical protein ANTPLA_LOCUS1704 [Anthophora plagiata]
MATASANASANTSDNAGSHVLALKQKRRVFKRLITTVGNWLETYTDSAKERSKLRERIQRLRTQFDSFNEIQDELAILEGFEEAQTERENTTEHYDDVIATAITLLENLERPATQTPAATIRLASDSPAPSTSTTAIGVHLPKIDLPKFDGRLEKWLTFKDAFQSMIHAHPGLTDIQRMSYLRLSLTGKAVSAIESFMTSEDSYKAAWDQLIQAYDNTRALVLQHTALLINEPEMPNDNAESICDLVNHMQSHIRSLHALGRSGEDIANDILVSLVISKMGPETRRVWEQTLTDTQTPKIDDIFMHLRNASHRCQRGDTKGTTSRNVDNAEDTQRKTVTNNANRRPASPRKAPPSRYQPPSPRASKRQTFVTKSATPCKICNAGSHEAYQCRQFHDMSIHDRVQAIRKAKLCENCLRSDHTTNECRAGKCRVCNGRHNTKIHQESTTKSDTVS